MFGRVIWSDWAGKGNAAFLGRSWAIGAAGAALAFGLLWSRTASACSTIGPSASLRGYPSNGETDVPTDVVPFYASDPSSDLFGAKFTLTPSAGDAIAGAGASVHSGLIDVTFEKALQPNTTYTLVVKLLTPVPPDNLQSLSLSFTTGSGPVSAVPDPPQGFLQHYQLGQPRQSSCSPWERGTCVAMTATFPVELSETFSGQELGPAYLFTDSSFWSVLNDGVCFKLRTRAPNATYSSPVVLCDADIPVFTIVGSEMFACTSQGITQDDVLLPASGGVVHGWAGSPSTTWVGSGGSSAGLGGALAGEQSAGGGGDFAGAGGSSAGVSNAAPVGGAPVAGAGAGLIAGGGGAHTGIRIPASPTVESCALVAPRGRSANAALGALFALALLGIGRRSRSSARRAPEA